MMVWNCGRVVPVPERTREEAARSTPSDVPSPDRTGPGRNSDAKEPSARAGAHFARRRRGRLTEAPQPRQWAPDGLSVVVTGEEFPRGAALYPLSNIQHARTPSRRPASADGGGKHGGWLWRASGMDGNPGRTVFHLSSGVKAILTVESEIGRRDSI